MMSAVPSSTNKSAWGGQVFDKALGEPGFSNIYARLCHDLNQVLPKFKGVDQDGKEEDVEFRRVLLNKCQYEFEEGGAAMRAVEAREKRQQEEEAAAKVCPSYPHHCCPCFVTACIAGTAESCTYSSDVPRALPEACVEQIVHLYITHRTCQLCQPGLIASIVRSLDKV